LAQFSILSDGNVIKDYKTDEFARPFVFVNLRGKFSLIGILSMKRFHFCLIALVIFSACFALRFDTTAQNETNQT